MMPWCSWDSKMCEVGQKRTLYYTQPSTLRATCQRCHNEYDLQLWELLLKTPQRIRLWTLRATSKYATTCTTLNFGSYLPKMPCAHHTYIPGFGKPHLARMVACLDLPAPPKQIWCFFMKQTMPKMLTSEVWSQRIVITQPSVRGRCITSIPGLNTLRRWQGNQRCWEVKNSYDFHAGPEHVRRWQGDQRCWEVKNSYVVREAAMKPHMNPHSWGSTNYCCAASTA
jgi:hypothetical protein